MIREGSLKRSRFHLDLFNYIQNTIPYFSIHCLSQRFNMMITLCIQGGLFYIVRVFNIQCSMLYRKHQVFAYQEPFSATFMPYTCKYPI